MPIRKLEGVREIGFIVISLVVLVAVSGLQPLSANDTGGTCITCHQATTPGIVTDWKLSKHATEGVTCETCHGKGHTTATDAANAGLVGPETCGRCHEGRVKEFAAGKHALAWKCLAGIPMSKVHMEGGKGCGGCHKIGLKDEKEMAAFKEAGTSSQGGSCDACHTRHTFSRTEALQPQACQMCHQGEGQPNWLIYSASKHGMRNELKQLGALPKDVSAPTCQSCHMPKGSHAVKTAWGLFGLRLPLPDDPEWAADRVTIFQGMGLFGMDGKPTPMAEGFKALDMMRFTNEDFQKERDKMTAICAECHTASFVRTDLAKGDALLREADKLMAQGIREVASLYKDGIVKKPEAYPAPFPMVMSNYEAPNPAEARLFNMFLVHRTLIFESAFHSNPQFPSQFGYEEMMRDLYEIKKEAAALRKEKH